MPLVTLTPAGQRQPDVHAVAHVVRPQRLGDRGGDLRVGRDAGEPERRRGAAQPGQVRVEAEDPPVVQPQPLPHRVAALHHRVERRDARLVPVPQHAVDPVPEVGVALVVPLQHAVFFR